MANEQEIEWCIKLYERTGVLFMVKCIRCGLPMDAPGHAVKEYGMVMSEQPAGIIGSVVGDPARWE